MSLPPCTTAALPPTRAPGMSAMPTHRFCPLSYRSAERRRPLPSTPPATTTLPPTTPAAALYRVSGRSATAVPLQLPLPISYATTERSSSSPRPSPPATITRPVPLSHAAAAAYRPSGMSGRECHCAWVQSPFGTWRAATVASGCAEDAEDDIPPATMSLPSPLTQAAAPPARTRAPCNTPQAAPERGEGKLGPADHADADGLNSVTVEGLVAAIILAGFLAAAPFSLKSS